MKSINLTCLLQGNDLPGKDNVLNGLLSVDCRGFRFEETLPRPKRRRNPKLFDGRYMTMTRSADGCYSCNMKSLPRIGSMDSQELAYRMYLEMTDAFKVME